MNFNKLYVIVFNFRQLCKTERVNFISKWHDTPLSPLHLLDPLPPLDAFIPVLHTFLFTIP